MFFAKLGFGGTGWTGESTIDTKILGWGGIDGFAADVTTHCWNSGGNVEIGLPKYPASSLDAFVRNGAVHLRSATRSLADSPRPNLEAVVHRLSAHIGKYAARSGSKHA